MNKSRAMDFADPDTFVTLESFADLAACPYSAVTPHPGYTPVLDYETVRTISKDSRTFSSEEKTILVQTPEGDDLKTQRHFLLNMDEPRHSRVRGIVAEAFSVRAIEARRTEIERVVAEQTARLCASQPVEFVDHYATPVTLRIILMLMGLNDDNLDFIRRCTEDVVYTDDSRYNPTGQEGKAAATALFTYAMQLYRSSETLPEHSVLKRLTTGFGENHLSEQEFCFFFIFILAAGYETTRSMLCNMMSILAQEADILPDIRRSPDTIGNLVEEMLRFDPPVIQMCRTAMADAAIGSHRFQTGDKLGLVYPMANRDAQVFAEPHLFQPERPNAAKHLSFGTGRHKCLGAHLARLEMACVIKDLSKRFDRVDILEIDRVRSNFTRSTRQMVVCFT
jgi:cholest-4-en-3-one 26-monooxygenase